MASPKSVQAAPLSCLEDVAIPARAEPAGAEVTLTLTVKESEPPAVANGAVTVIGVRCSAPTAPVVGTVPTVIAVGAMLPAVAGAMEVITPKPNAETITSAKRLKDVLLDISFLSIVDPRTFPESAR